MGLNLRTSAAGFAGGAVVLAVLASLVGVEETLATLGTARPGVAVAVVCAATVWLLAWALALRAVLGALGASVSWLRAGLVYTSVLFANNVTPFGQAGGEPVSAVFISEAADTEYETALAAVASADTLNFVPSTAFALVGVTYLSAVLAGGQQLLRARAVVVVMAVAVPAVGYLVWRYRSRLETLAGGALAPLARAVGTALPRLEAPSRAAIEARIDGFFGSIETVATSRRRLALALGLSALGWLAQMVALWLSLYALGAVAPFAAVLVAVPVGAIAGITPLPGGLGGVEAALVALVVPLAGVSAATAAAAVVLHRGAIYWLPTLLGGAVVAAAGSERL
jgi:uncharacterized protein (TIRG00374 family)